MITVKTNGNELTLKQGTPHIEAAGGAGIDLPVLKHDPRVAPLRNMETALVGDSGGRHTRFASALSRSWEP